MPRTIYIRDEKSGSPLLRRLLVMLLVLALAGGAAVGLYIIQGNTAAATVLDDFQKALSENRYDDAIILYRITQEKSLTAGWLDQHQKTYQDALSAMEKLTDEMLQSIENQLRQNGQLTATDLAFVEKMAEVSAVRLTAFLRKLCIDYIAGRIGRPIMENAFSQLAALPNLHDAVGDLPAEFDQMTTAQPQMMAALADLAAQKYWPSWQGFAAILADDKLKGFVQEQARLRQAECQQAMYGPLLQAAQQMMDGGRYLSAQTALKKMSAVFTDDPAILGDLAVCAGQVPEVLIDYSGAVEVISIKPLIVNTKKAFDGDSYAAAANDSMLTVKEFKSMLAQLYSNNFILIDSSRLYTSDRKLAKIQLPAGKKPLILVLEGLNYYATRRQTGNSWDLVLDEGGEVSAEYMNDSGQMVMDREGEAIGILDVFVKGHPDFSLDGAKGTISLTGYEGVFGTITNQDQLDDRNQALQDNGMAVIDLSAAEIAVNYQKVQTIIERLKNTGWLFASSTYGFIDARSQSLEKIQADTAKWLAQVGSLTGPVAFLNYPNGAFLPGSDERAIWLKSQGFILFGGLGTTAYLYAGADYIYIDKTPINGFTLRNSQTYQLSRLFDVRKVYDPSVRPK